MFILTDGEMYVGNDGRNKPTVVNDSSRAMEFKTSAAAKNYLKCIPDCIKGHIWTVVDLDNDLEDIMPQEESEFFPVRGSDRLITMMELENFDAYEFFSKVITVMAQIDAYIENMEYKQQTTEMKMLDVRHYMRNEDHKFNAVQMQRLGYYLQDLEKERYKYKSNKLIAAMVANNMDAMKNLNTIKKMNDILTSQYKPRILDDVDIEHIINKKKSEDEVILKVC